MVQEIQEQHTYCAKDYSAQIKFLEACYLLEKEQERVAEEERRQKLLLGTQDRQESEPAPKEWPKHLPEKVYRNRTEFMIAKMEQDG